MGACSSKDGVKDAEKKPTTTEEKPADAGAEPAKEAPAAESAPAEAAPVEGAWEWSIFHTRSIVNIMKSIMANNFYWYQHICDYNNVNL